MTLAVKFWGTRGSIPTPPSATVERETLAGILTEATPADIADRAAIDAFIADGCGGAWLTRYAGNTSGVEVRAGNGDRLLIDIGSGARVFATETMAAQGPVLNGPLDVLLSHPHWDHIQGFPFFQPAFVPGSDFKIYGAFKADSRLEDSLRGQMGSLYFPITMSDMPGSFTFHELLEQDFEIEQMKSYITGSS